MRNNIEREKQKKNKKNNSGRFRFVREEFFKMEARKSEKNDCAHSHRQTSGAPFLYPDPARKEKLRLCRVACGKCVNLNLWRVCGIIIFRFSRGPRWDKRVFSFLFLFKITNIPCAMRPCFSRCFISFIFVIYLIFIWFLEKEKRVQKKKHRNDSKRRWWNRKNDDISGPGGPDALGWTDPLHSHCR